MGFILLFLEASPCGAGPVQLRFTISFRTGLNTAPSCLPDAKHQLRGNVSTSALPGDFRDVLQRRLGDLERQLLRKVAELEDEKSLLHNETSAHRQKTESALNALLERVTELEPNTFPSAPQPPVFQHGDSSQTQLAHLLNHQEDSIPGLGHSPTLGDQAP